MSARTATGVALLALAALSACAYYATPYEGLGQPSQPGQSFLPVDGAVTRAGGVQMLARAGVWDGTPTNLAERLTPMKVTIRNDSPVSIRVRYNEFMLTLPHGKVLKALPPFQIDAQTARSVAPFYPATGFRYAPYYSSYMPSASLYGGRFENDAAYWSRYAPVLGTVDLPTADMLARALPEGVVEPGGSVAGFLYFAGVGNDVARVGLRADLVNADTGQLRVSLTLPFVVGTSGTT